MKTTALILFLVLLVSAVFAKFTAQSERIANVGLMASWSGAGQVPDAATVSADFAHTIVNDENANDTIERRTGSISFDGLRTDRNVQVGAGPSLTYRQVTLYYLKMVQDARANPPAN